MDVSGVRSLLNFCIVGRVAAISDVVADVVVEQHSVLGDDAHTAP